MPKARIVGTLRELYFSEIKCLFSMYIIIKDSNKTIGI